MKILVTVQVDSGEAILVQHQKMCTVLNPNPRDVAGHGDLAIEEAERVFDQLKQETIDQLTVWKHAVLQALGG